MCNEIFSVLRKYKSTRESAKEFWISLKNREIEREKEIRRLTPSHKENRIIANL